MNRVCPICGKEIKERSRVQSCNRCGTVHHSICFMTKGCGECSFARRKYVPTRPASRAERKDYATNDSRGIFGFFFKNTGRSIKRMAKTLLLTAIFAFAAIVALSVYFAVTRASALPALVGIPIAAFALIFLISRSQLTYALGERTENSAKMLDALSDVEYRLAKVENKGAEE